MVRTEDATRSHEAQSCAAYAKALQFGLLRMISIYGSVPLVRRSEELEFDEDS